MLGQMTYSEGAREIVEEGSIIIPVHDFTSFKPHLIPGEGNVLVINFWATWCKPCIEEIPDFVILAKELEGKGTDFLFVSLDFRKNLERSVISFVKENGLEGRTILLHDPDANSWIDQVDPSWSGAIPATLVVKGKEKKFYEKKLSYDEIKTIVNSF
jgi:thiol-disulfide isomerase/thioredoxin